MGWGGHGPKSGRHRVDPKKIERRCESQKVCFPDKEKALAASEQQMLQGRVLPGCHIMPYRCDRCGSWHLANHIIVPLGKKTRASFQGLD
jgi:hypothetical protein